MNKICLALIHNNNQERNIYIKQKLVGLSMSLRERFDVTSFEVAYQPEVVPYSSSMTFLRNIVYQVLDYRWRQYRCHKSASLILPIYRALRSTLIYKTLTRRPWLRIIGVDWMMNTLLMRLGKNGIGCDCMHADPTFFKHGSATGEYRPWVR